MTQIQMMVLGYYILDIGLAGFVLLLFKPSVSRAAKSAKKKSAKKNNSQNGNAVKVRRKKLAVSSNGVESISAPESSRHQGDTWEEQEGECSDKEDGDKEQAASNLNWNVIHRLIAFAKKSTNLNSVRRIHKDVSGARKRVSASHNSSVGRNFHLLNK